MCNAFWCFLKIATWYWYRWQIPISIRNQFWNMLACNEKGYERHLAPSQPSMPSRRHVHQPKRLPQMSSRRIMSWRVQYGPWMSMSGSFHISGRWGKKTLWSGCCRISFRSEMSSTTAWISMLQTNHFSNLHRFWVQYTFAAWKQSSHFQAFFISTVRTVPVRRRWIVPRVNMIPELPTFLPSPNHIEVLKFYLSNQIHVFFLAIWNQAKQKKKNHVKKIPPHLPFFFAKNPMHAGLCVGFLFGVIGIPRVEDWKYVVGFPEPYWWSKPEGVKVAVSGPEEKSSHPTGSFRPRGFFDLWVRQPGEIIAVKSEHSTATQKKYWKLGKDRDKEFRKNQPEDRKLKQL